MTDKTVGKVKNFKFNKETEELEVTFYITDPIFKKEILRNFYLSGKIYIDKEELREVVKENA